MSWMPASTGSSEAKRWRVLGNADPYWAVCTEERFRTSRMSPQDREEFFASGATEVEATLASIRRHVDADFRPAASLDYGCGVGRLTIPIARVSRTVVGVDISESMLREARSNAVQQGIENITFQLAGDTLPVDPPDLDFVHSYIVFQHIAPRKGIGITRSLLHRLRHGGVGALHYTFARQAGLTRLIVHRLRRHLSPVNFLVNLLQGRRLTEPMIPVYQYDLNHLFSVFLEAGCSAPHVTITNHGGHLGAMFIFRKLR
jgi:SAM-dependent methyltransferase